MRSRRYPGVAPVRHSDDWLITYADTITVLLCVFVVLLAVRGVRPQLARPAPPPPMAMAAPAFPPLPIFIVKPRTGRPLGAATAGRMAGHGGNGPAALAGGPGPATGSPAKRVPSRLAPRFAATASPRAIPPADRVQPAGGVPRLRPLPGTGAPPDAVAAQAAPQDTVAAQAAPRDAVAAQAAPQDAVAAQAAPQEGRAASPVLGSPTRGAISSPIPPRASPDRSAGDRIVIIQCSDTAFFASGSVILSQAGRHILATLLPTLGEPKFAGYRITVEGHTDDEPIRDARYPSNWELSAARAASVVRFFVAHGIAPDRLRAVGLGDTRPLAPNRDAAGDPIPANQAKNRRVVVELEKIDRAGDAARP